MKRWVLSLCLLVVFALGVELSLAQGITFTWVGYSVASFNLPGSPLAVYSTRKVVPAYAGFAVKLQKIVGTTVSTQNIGFVSGNFDITSAKTFCGNVNCTIVELYDQSGNGNNSFPTPNNQGTHPANGPQLFIDNNNKAWIASTYSDQFTAIAYSGLLSGSLIPLTGDQTIGANVMVESARTMQLGNSDGTNGYALVFNGQGSSNDTGADSWWSSIQTGSNPGSVSYWSNTGYTTPDSSNITGHVASVVATRTSGTVATYVNGAQTSSAAPQTTIASADGFQIGGITKTPSQQFEGLISELYIYGSALSAAQVASIASSEAAYWPDLGFATPYSGASEITPGYGQNVQLGNVLNYQYTQPWTAYAALQLYAAPDNVNQGTSGSPIMSNSAFVILTNVPGNVTTQTAYPGYEVFLDYNTCVLHVRLISNISAGVFLGVFGSTKLCDGKEHFVAASNSGSGTAAGIKLYVDGNPETLTTEADALAGGSIIGSGSTANSLWVGGQASYPGYSVRGSMGHVQIDNIVQSAAFIAAHSTPASLPPVGANTVLSLALTEGAGSVAHDASASGFNGTLSNPNMWIPPVNNTIPTVVAGTAIPQSEDNAHPSMSRWAPSCLDATWGVGCNVATQTCIAPTVGTPIETCQPPQQLVVTGGSGNGTTATINYTSYANYAFPVGTPLNIIGSTNWDTPNAAAISLTQSTSGTCTTPGDTCASWGLAPVNNTIGPVNPGSVPFIPHTPVYIGGAAGNWSNFGGGPNWNFGWGQSITGGTYDNVAGTLTVTLANPVFGASPSGAYTFSQLSYTGGTCPSTSTSVPPGTPPGTCGLGGPFSLTSSSGGGTTLVFTPGAGLSNAVLTLTAGRIFGNGTAGLSGQQGPNGKYVPDGTWSGPISTINFDLQTSQPFGFQGSLTGLSGPLSNNFGYSGFLTQPWPVTASTCNTSTHACSVSFAHPISCASSCVSATTQIVATQFNGPVIGWMTGPIAPFAVENGTQLKCVDVKSVPPIRLVKIAVNGGTFTSAALVPDPWGVGNFSISQDPYQSQLTNKVNVYCVQLPASTVADGLLEWRAIVCAYSGPCSQLTSAITADTTAGSSTLKSNMHYQNDTARLAVTNSVDPAFKLYNAGVNTNVADFPISAASFTAGSPPTATYTYDPTTSTSHTGQQTLPLQVGQPINISGSVTANQCPITGGSANGNTIQYTYSGGCNFPVGSQVNIAGLNTPPTISQSISSVAYNSGTGLLSITLNAAAWGTSPGFNNVTQWTISGTTGTGTNQVNGSRIQSSFTGSGTVLNIQTFTGLTISINPGTGNVTGVTSNGSPYTWNGNNVPVIATNGSNTISVTGMSLGNFPTGSGTITENWNGLCVPTAATGTTVTCQLPTASPSTTVNTFGNINAQAYIMCVVGGPGDNPPPFNPAFQFGSTMTPNTFQLQYLLTGSTTNAGVNRCSSNSPNQTGCSAAPCGTTATINSTIWLYRHNAGTKEVRENGHSNASLTPPQEDGSLWTYANAGGTIQEQAAYVDTWNPSASTTPSACVGPLFSAMSWNATRPTYTGSYCANATIARGVGGMYWGSQPVNNSLAIGATLGVSGGCTTFFNSLYNVSNVAPGVPVIFYGADAGAAGDGSNGLFTNGAFYWVQSASFGTLTLARTPGGPCINEPTANFIGGVRLQQDLGFKDIFFKCNTAAGCSNSNPETTYARTNSGGGFGAFPYPETAISGWFTYAPDTANGTTQHQVDLIWGPSATSTFNLTGRIHSQLDRSYSDLVLTPAATLGPTLPTSAVTGGSFSAGAVGACPGNCETLNFAAGVNQFTGAKYQAPTSSGNPGQGLVISGVTGSSGTWNCGTLTSPCLVTSSTTTSVTFVNASASGTWSSGGTIVPVTLVMEVAAGTFPNTSTAVNNFGCTQSANTAQALSPPPGAVACVAAFTASTTLSNGLTNLFPVNIGNTQPSTSNCVQTNQGGGGGTNNPQLSNLPINSIIPSPIAGKNDIIIMASTTASLPAVAWNQCASIQFSMAESPFIGAGATESWDDGSTVNGPGWWQGAQLGQPGHLISAPGGGASFVTNHIAIQVADDFDEVSYVWGSVNLYNPGGCHSSAGSAFHLRCITEGHTAPQPYGTNFATPATVTNSYASWADWISNSPIQCSVNSGPNQACILAAGTPPTGVTCTPADCQLGSHLFVLADKGSGAMSGDMTVGLALELSCNFYAPTGTGAVSAATTGISPAVPTGGLVNNSISWLDRNQNVIMTGTPPTGACVNIASSAAYIENGYHTDTNFMRTGPIEQPTIAHEFVNRLPWNTGNNIIIDQLDLRGGHIDENLFTEGGINMNFVVANSYLGCVQPPNSFDGCSGLDTNSYGSINWLNINDQIAATGVVQTTYNANGSPSYFFKSPLIDVYYINTNPAFANTVSQSPGYPAVDLLAGSNSEGYRGTSTGQWAMNGNTAEQPQVVSPIPTWGVYPSNAWATDISGNAIAGAASNFNSLYACPWYCAATDIGNSLQ